MAKKKEPAAGTVKEAVEEGAMLGGNGQAKLNGLQVMNEKDVNDYLEELMQAQQPLEGLETLELGALAQFRGINQQSGDTERQLTRAQAQVEQLKAKLSRLQGQSEAYVNLLVLAEDARRAEAKAEA